jgi:hypothetical protein
LKAREKVEGTAWKCIEDILSGLGDFADKSKRTDEMVLIEIIEMTSITNILAKCQSHDYSSKE